MTGREALQRWGWEQLKTDNPSANQGAIIQSDEQRSMKFSDAGIEPGDVTVEFDEDWLWCDGGPVPVISIWASQLGEFKEGFGWERHTFATCRHVRDLDLGDLFDEVFKIFEEHSEESTDDRHDQP